MIAPCCGVHHLQAIPAGLTSDSTCSHNSPQSGIQDHTTLRPALHPSCRQQRPPPACHHVRATHRGATSSHDRMLSTTSSHDSMLPTITIPVYNNGGIPMVWNDSLAGIPHNLQSSDTRPSRSICLRICARVTPPRGSEAKKQFLSPLGILLREIARTRRNVIEPGRDKRA
jgi:hypothetical protein